MFKNGTIKNKLRIFVMVAPLPYQLYCILQGKKYVKHLIYDNKL